MTFRWLVQPAPRSIALLLLIVAVFNVDAAVLPKPERSQAHPHQGMSLTARDQLCGFSGNPDIYGLGIRLGLYMLWTATILTYELLEDEVSNAVDTNVVFFFSISVATLVLSSQSPRPYPEELFVLLSMFFGGFYSLAFPSKANSFSVWGMMLRGYLVCAMSGYSVWFWFNGAGLMTSQPPECKSNIFLFARVALFGPARKFFQAISILNLIFVGGFVLFTELFLGMPGIILVTLAGSIIVVLVIIVITWEFCKGKGSERIAAIRTGFKDPENRTMVISLFVAFSRPMMGIAKENVKEKIIPAVEERKGKQPLWRRYPWWNVALLIWTIVTIEMTLRWNKVTNVNSIASTGQLIPFVTGIAGLLKVLYSWIAERAGRSKYNTGLNHLTNEDDEYEMFPRKVGQPVRIKKDSRPERRQSW